MWSAFHNTYNVMSVEGNVGGHIAVGDENSVGDKNDNKRNRKR